MKLGMPKRVILKEHLSHSEIKKCYRQCKDPVEKVHWLLIMRMSQSPQQSIANIATGCGLDRKWACRLVQRYNQQGALGLRDRRRDNGSALLLNASELQQLEQALESEPPDGGLWNGPKVALWMEKILKRKVSPVNGWRYLRRLGYRCKVPRPHHIEAASATEQTQYKKTGRRSH